MALSAISSRDYAMVRVVLPIAVDVVATIAMKLLAGNKIPPKAGWVIATLPACSAVYLTSGVPKWDTSGVVTCGLYMFYKAIPFFLSKGRAPLENLKPLHDQLMAKVTITYDGPNATMADIDRFVVSQLEQVLTIWKNAETFRNAESLITKAAIEMQALYEDLENAVPNDSSKLNRMAELLATRTGPNDYFSRFWKPGSVSLLDIYRDIRALRVNVKVQSTGEIVRCSIIESCNLLNVPVDDRVERPFSTWGDYQSVWRTTYNHVLSGFQVIIHRMDKTLEGSKAFKAWVEKDVGVVFKDEVEGPYFKICPCPKPK